MMDIVNATQSNCGNAEACLDKDMTCFRHARKIRKGSIAKGKKNNENFQVL